MNISITIISIIITVFCGLVVYAYISDKNNNNEKVKKLDCKLDEVFNLLAAINNSIGELIKHNALNYQHYKQIDNQLASHIKDSIDYRKCIDERLAKIQEAIATNEKNIMFLQGIERLNKLKD